jgi:hypothetical protein
MTRLLIRGSSMRLRAFSSAPVMRMFPHDTSSVWRFGSNVRHLTSKGTVDWNMRFIVRDLQKTQISPDSATNEWMGVPHAHTKTRIRA